MIPAKAASKVLRRAAERLGGVELLAAYLGLTTEVIQRQIAGTSPVTEAEYLKAVDLVLEDVSIPRADSSARPPSG